MMSTFFVILMYQLGGNELAITTSFSFLLLSLLASNFYLPPISTLVLSFLHCRDLTLLMLVIYSLYVVCAPLEIDNHLSEFL